MHNAGGTTGACTDFEDEITALVAFGVVPDGTEVVAQYARRVLWQY